MKIFGNQRFSIHIRELDHQWAHCHVRFGDQSEVCVAIPEIEPMYGASISREVRDAIENNLDALTDAWDRLHPKRPEVSKKEKLKQPTKKKTK